ncbi:MAG: tRNA (cytidine(34)-2'-O)-methyltransferase [Phycisphaerae bacterium]|jgi:tRNA (cytidine/uridine-2'-O-)-methyltransferase|nr:tRNA (cytidine(34)-2'-O)-methyltransferase [Phycisphaerae bacterium]MBT6269067.1 tRNA (cytidine(34)-2'-O)-methyltransferase [Phycisphaerae bacterium]MBT6282717.1 tRNA (cytidine(34)-2'-O)-methyltransferase [Phycisphaerae bacterium]
MAEPLFNIVLLAPQIPNNTGNIGRTAMATGCRLHIIHPIAFDMDEKAVRRAGLDYWHLLDIREHESWRAFLEKEHPNKLWLFTTKSTKPLWDASFTKGDYLLFGSEQHGVPKEVHEFVGKKARLTLPMVSEARSLNLATAVCAAVYEGFRQTSTS